MKHLSQGAGKKRPLLIHMQTAKGSDETVHLHSLARTLTICQVSTSDQWESFAKKIRF